MESNSNKDYYYYEKLCFFDYEGVVKELNNINGPVEKDYFGRISYQNYMKDLNRKNIKKTKLMGRKEGLWVHHVKENELSNLGYPNAIRKNNIDFSYQEKKNLVYCDLAEHLILHAIIEGNKVAILKKSGSPSSNGYSSILKQFKNWYMCNGKSPERLLPFKMAVKLSSSEAEKLFKLVDKIARKQKTSSITLPQGCVDNS